MKSSASSNTHLSSRLGSAVKGRRGLHNISGKKLERDKPAEFRVLRLVDHTHPTSTKLLDNEVMRDGLAISCEGVAIRERVIIGVGRIESQRWPRLLQLRVLRLAFFRMGMSG